MKPRRCGVLVDRLSAGGNSSAQAPGTLRNHFREAASCVAGLRVARGRSFEKRLPLEEQPSIAVTIQRLDEPLVLPLLRLAQVDRQCLHVVSRNIVSVFSMKREDEHVQVARRPVRRPIHPNSVEKCSTAAAGRRA